MPELLAKWIMRRYLVLWQKFGTDKFTFDEAVKELEDKSEITSLFLSELKKAEWLDIQLDEKDSRKRIYQLRPLDKVFKEIAKEVSV
jgi:hypothetical protein